MRPVCPGHTEKKKAYTALLQCRTFPCQKKWGLQRKDFGGRYGFPGFHRVFVSTTDLESFSLRPEKSPKRFSFGGGRVRFFLLCKSTWVGVLWVGLRVAMWITHVGGANFAMWPARKVTENSLTCFGVFSIYFPRILCLDKLRRFLETWWPVKPR